MGQKSSTPNYNGGHTTDPHTTTGGAGTTTGHHHHNTGTTGHNNDTTGHHTTTATDRHHKSTTKKSGAFFSTLMHTILNMLIFATILGLCGHLFNSWANGNSRSTSLFTSVEGMALLFFSVLSAAVGLATMIQAAIHGSHLTESSRQGALSSNLVTFALCAISFCFACKAIHTGIAKSGSSKIQRELCAVAALDIIALATMLFYLAQLGLFKHNRHENTLPTHYSNTQTTGAYPAGTHTHGATTQPKSVEMHHNTTTTGGERAYAA